MEFIFGLILWILFIIFIVKKMKKIKKDKQKEYLDELELRAYEEIYIEDLKNKIKNEKKANKK